MNNTSICAAELTQNRSWSGAFWITCIGRARRLPDDVRRYIREIPCEADFFYEPKYLRFSATVAVHDRPEQRAKDREIRTRLKERGYRVIVIRYDRDLEEQIDEHKDVFLAFQSEWAEW
jgi:hypothetical protein